MQLTAVWVMALMAMALIWLLPPKVKQDEVANRSRWLMTAGLLLLGVQFLLQYIFGFRQMGVMKAVMLNLTLLIPVSALLALSIFNLQRQGRLNSTHKWIVVPTWLLVMTILAVGVLTDDEPLNENSHHMLWMEVAASAVFGLMQLYYGVHISDEMLRMRHVLNDYFDTEQDGLLRWMQISFAAMTLVALAAPLCIFLPGKWLAAFGFFVIITICYLWFCFVRYVTTSAASRMREAEGNSLASTASSNDTMNLRNSGNFEEASLRQGEIQRIETLVAQWLEQGSHLRHDVKRDDAAKEIGVPKRLLSTWVKVSGYDSYSQWITTLRIEEAKRMLIEHRDWSIEAVADHCGISRQNFHKVFQERTGKTPAKFQEPKVKNS